MAKVNLAAFTILMHKNNEVHTIDTIIDQKRINYGSIEYFIDNTGQFKINCNFTDDELKAIATAAEVILQKAMNLARK